MTWERMNPLTIIIPALVGLTVAGLGLIVVGSQQSVELQAACAEQCDPAAPVIVNGECYCDTRYSKPE